MQLAFVVLFIACCIPGWSVACDLGNCLPDYPEAQNPATDNGCPAWNAARCEKWRLFDGCLMEVASGFRCQEYRFELSTKKATTENVLHCHCNKNRTATVDTPRASCSIPQAFTSYAACVLFGDPHLITVSREEQTCSLPKRHRLFEYGEDLTVDVVNVNVASQMDATGTSKVIVRYGPSECVGGEVLVFTATALDFRPYFDDGTYAKDLINASDVNLIELKADWLGIKVLVRRAGMYLSVSVQLPVEIEGIVGGLCRSGCPSDQLLLDKLPLSSQQVTPEHIAFYACDHLEEDTFFFKSCVFDVRMTGDLNFTVAAVKAMNDVNTLRSSLGALSSNASPIPTKRSDLLPITLLLFSLFI